MWMLRNRYWIFDSSVWSVALAVLVASERAAAVDYLKELKPLFEHKCYSCHGALKQQSGLRLDTVASIRLGGDSGSAVNLASPNESLILAAVRGEAGLRMPPENEGTPLKPVEIELLQAWIAAGALSPEHEEPQTDPRTWWSYQPLEISAVPDVLDAGWCRNPIDHFVAATRDAHELKPVVEVSKTLWLRRVYLDLIGLPPTREELHLFSADDSEFAYERVVERLLASPQYGERWGRHWMDIWRYSDWYGSRAINEIRYSQRHLWRWRDWIVESLNADRGYDSMIRDMLAADELAGNEAGSGVDSLVATGYLGRNWYKFDRDVWLFDSVERTSEALLGLTLRCCRCHDHKFDPISQVEYYRFRAFFEPHDVRTDPILVTTPSEKDSTLGAVLSDGIALVYDKNLVIPTYRFERGDSRFPDKSSLLTPGVPGALDSSEIAVAPVELPVEVWYPMLRPELRESLLKQAAATVTNATQKRDQAKDEARLLLEDDFQQPDRDAKSSETERKLWQAEAELEIALADQQATHARLAAEVAKYIERDQSQFSAKARLARRTELLAKLRRAEVDVAKSVLAEPAAIGLLHKSSSATASQFLEQLAKLITLAGSAETLKPGQTQNKLLSEAFDKLTEIRAVLEKAQATEAEDYSPLGTQYPQTSTGRRRALADWIASKDNLRTARVAVNHIWGRHFGQPLVATPENFGLNGRKPTHPQLLDWLASRLMADDWKMKPLHRLIVLSSTYRMASTAEEDRHEHRGLTDDPTNQFLWRMNAKRMEAEVVRDSILNLAQHLDKTFGGCELAETNGESIARRSLYFRNTPNEKMSMLEVFDVADPNACYRRKESVVPHQSLALMNSGLILDHSKLIASHLAADPLAVKDVHFITSAFETTLARTPSMPELQMCAQFLIEQSASVTASDEPRFPAGGSAKRQPADQSAARARENLVQVLLLHNDFITIR